MSKGNTFIVEAPEPKCGSREVIIKTSCSLISAGTERMLVEFGRASIFEKARQQPEKVGMVLQKVKTDGLLITLDAVKTKLAQPLALGYCNVGVVIEVGSSVENLKIGDRVASNGPHADIVRVPKNLCVRIPADVSDEAASFVVLASIGLQGIRLAKPSLGEVFVVTGVGLIGLLVVQLLRAHGCAVLAIDFDEAKLALARQYGAVTCNPGVGEDPVSCGMALSRGQGVDGVIITASTKSNDPVAQAARMSRKRGRIVLVGVTGLELNRADFYEKELTFQVSCSYGPGRYDSKYEKEGLDYPIGFVRWTEQRNFEAVLDMLSSGKLAVQPLLSHRFPFNSAQEAYAVLAENRKALGILLQYDNAQRTAPLRHLQTLENIVFDKRKPVLGFIGAGNYASRTLIPAFKKAGAQFHTIVTQGGVSAVIHGEKAGFAQASTDVASVIASNEINAAVIVTRHNSHANLVADVLAAGKSVFVEKPLAIDAAGLERVKASFRLAHSVEGGGGPILMVGFNRRFAPQIKKMRDLISPLKAPKAFIMTMNAGSIPSDHWTQDPAIGGGRIIGEACHFIDLMRFLANSPIVSVQARRVENLASVEAPKDSASITLGFADGSFGTILYLSNGEVGYPKERVEIFVAGRVLQLNNFRKLKGYGWPEFDRFNLWRQDKGQGACAAAFLASLEDGIPAIPVDEVFEVAQVTLEVAECLRKQ